MKKLLFISLIAFYVTTLDAQTEENIPCEECITYGGVQKSRVNTVSKLTEYTYRYYNNCKIDIEISWDCDNSGKGARTIKAQSYEDFTYPCGGGSGLTQLTNNCGKTSPAKTTNKSTSSSNTSTTQTTTTSSSTNRTSGYPTTSSSTTNANRRAVDQRNSKVRQQGNAVYNQSFATENAINNAKNELTGIFDKRLEQINRENAAKEAREEREYDARKRREYRERREEERLDREYRERKRMEEEERARTTAVERSEWEKTTQATFMAEYRRFDLLARQKALANNWGEPTNSLSSPTDLYRYLYGGLTGNGSPGYKANMIREIQDLLIDFKNFNTKYAFKGSMPALDDILDIDRLTFALDGWTPGARYLSGVRRPWLSPNHDFYNSNYEFAYDRDLKMLYRYIHYPEFRNSSNKYSAQLRYNYSRRSSGKWKSVSNTIKFAAPFEKLEDKDFDLLNGFRRDFFKSAGLYYYHSNFAHYRNDDLPVIEWTYNQLLREYALRGEMDKGYLTLWAIMTIDGIHTMEDFINLPVNDEDSDSYRSPSFKREQPKEKVLLHNAAMINYFNGDFLTSSKLFLQLMGMLNKYADSRQYFSGNVVEFNSPQTPEPRRQYVFWSYWSMYISSQFQLGNYDEVIKESIKFNTWIDDCFASLKPEHLGMNQLMIIPRPQEIYQSVYLSAYYTKVIEMHAKALEATGANEKEILKVLNPIPDFAEYSVSKLGSSGAELFRLYEKYDPKTYAKKLDGIKPIGEMPLPKQIANKDLQSNPNLWIDKYKPEVDQLLVAFDSAYDDQVYEIGTKLLPTLNADAHGMEENFQKVLFRASYSALVTQNFAEGMAFARLLLNANPEHETGEALLLVSSLLMGTIDIETPKYVPDSVDIEKERFATEQALTVFASEMHLYEPSSSDSIAGVDFLAGLEASFSNQGILTPLMPHLYNAIIIGGEQFVLNNRENTTTDTVNPPSDAPKTTEGFTRTESGLQYRFIKKTDGELVKDGNFATVEFIGKLSNGKEFENTYDIDTERIRWVKKGQMPDGWYEALLLMKAGEKAIFFMPPSLAYGSKGLGNLVPPNEPVTFEIEVISAR